MRAVQTAGVPDRSPLHDYGYGRIGYRRGAGACRQIASRRWGVKVSGFTFLNEAVERGYPFRESILSALPICDEFIVVAGPAEDGTVEAVTALGDPKIKMFRSQWNPHVRT